MTQSETITIDRMTGVVNSKLRILALDMATVSGWAYAENGKLIGSGTVTFDVRRGESPGMRFLRFRQWLCETWLPVLSRQPLDLVVYEQAHHRGGPATACGVGLTTTLLTWCAEHGVEHMPCHTATLKKHAADTGHASKEQMIDAALRRWGVIPFDDNEADALCLASWALDGFPQPESKKRKAKVTSKG